MNPKFAIGDRVIYNSDKPATISEIKFLFDRISYELEFDRVKANECFAPYHYKGASREELLEMHPDTDLHAWNKLVSRMQEIYNS